VVDDIGEGVVDWGYFLRHVGDARDDGANIGGPYGSLDAGVGSFLLESNS
jgi:hypothetical protein